jgi:hypothetical protein
MRMQVLKLPLLVGLLALLVGVVVGNSHGMSTQRSVDAAIPPPTPIVRVVVHTRIVPHTVVRVRTLVHTVVRMVTRTRVVNHVVIHVVTKTVKVPVTVYRTHVVTRTVVKTVQAAAPAPTATPTIQTLFNLSGSDNKQSDTFTAQGPFVVAWDASYTDSTLGSGEFSIELDDAQGNELDLIANTSHATKDETTEHADCSHGCYIKVSAVNMDWQTDAVQ